MTARLLRIADRVLEVLAFGGVALLMLAMLVVMADIVLRKSVGLSVRGSIDINQLGQMWCVFLVLPLVFLREGHIVVEFATDRLPPRALALVKACAGVACTALMGAVAWFSFVQAGMQAAQGDRSETLGLPMLLYWLPLVAGAALSALAAALLVARDLALAFGRPPPP